MESQKNNHTQNNKNEDDLELLIKDSTTLKDLKTETIKQGEVNLIIEG